MECEAPAAAASGLYGGGLYGPAAPASSFSAWMLLTGPQKQCTYHKRNMQAASARRSMIPETSVENLEAWLSSHAPQFKGLVQGSERAMNGSGWSDTRLLETNAGPKLFIKTAPLSTHTNVVYVQR
jgi:hypothetical protein